MKWSMGRVRVAKTSAKRNDLPVQEYLEMKMAEYKKILTNKNRDQRCKKNLKMKATLKQHKKTLAYCIKNNIN